MSQRKIPLPPFKKGEPPRNSAQQVPLFEKEGTGEISPIAKYAARPYLALNNTLLAWLLAALALVIAPHALRLPLWLTAFAAALIAWRYLAARDKLQLPGKWTLLLLALAASIGIGLRYGTIVGRDAGTALLITMLALKLLEMRTPRDTTLAVFLGYFLVITNFLYTQSLFIAAYLFVVAWLLTVCLIGIQQPHAPGLRAGTFKLGAKMLLQAVPIMLLLFVLFPRVSGPLWGLPKDAFAGMTGLSDTMTPGAISQLAQSDKVAFRVEFDGAPPPARLRYFRVLVMDRFDGRTWSPSLTRPLIGELHLQGPTLRYTLTLEPHDRPWLPAIDVVDPRSLPSAARLNHDFSVTQREPVHQRMRYTLVSHTAFAGMMTNEPPNLTRAVTLPAHGNPRARQLAQRLAAESRDTQELVTKVLAMFHNQPFVYTLRPPLLGQDSVDEFLFDTRRGFCEHYAGSFAFLMRAAGVPTRIVTGYQGGEYNDIGRYLIVRQADAHAWVEVWFANQGWVRVDPTGAVAANRIEQGIAQALPADEPLAFFVREPAPWLRQLQLNWDTLNNHWNQWVLGYDQERQVALLARAGLGIVSWRDLGVYLLVGIGIVVGLLAFFTLRERGNAGDKVQALYLRFCARLAKAGLARASSEGPRDFAARVGTLRPDLAPAVNDITERYIEQRYGAHASAHAFKTFQSRVRAFRA